MDLGIDVSSYLEVQNAGCKFFKNNEEIDPLDAFIDNDVKYMRIRLWNNPYSIDGEKYLGGTCDLNNFISLAKIATEKGYKILLDFHYSDFWADPGKQLKPKAWQNISGKELEKAVYDYTISTLNIVKENGIDIFMIQVGNEITNGFLWPDGKLYDNNSDIRDNYSSLAALLKMGIKACNEIYPNTLIMLHLERSYDNKVYSEFLSQMEKYDVSFDVLGASYYPYWHGTMDELFSNLNDIKNRYHKKIVIAELSYGFTIEDYILSDHNNLVVNTQMENLPYPLTKEGQKDFLYDFITRAKENDIFQIYYWEPLWLPGENICWASKAGQKYINEQSKDTRNEWANQCLFDYNGNMNPSFDIYKV